MLVSYKLGNIIHQGRIYIIFHGHQTENRSEINFVTGVTLTFRHMCGRKKKARNYTYFWKSADGMHRYGYSLYVALRTDGNHNRLWYRLCVRVIQALWMSTSVMHEQSNIVLCLPTYTVTERNIPISQETHYFGQSHILRNHSYVCLSLPSLVHLLLSM